jgi:hypothetical protein
MGMSPREVIASYRLYAAHCLEIAHEFEDRGRKIALLNMAQTWIALVDPVERAGGTTLGIPHPQSVSHLAVRVPRKQPLRKMCAT